MELLRGGRDLVRIGHRGAAALAPENTLAAVEAAAAHGVDAVELDVLPGRDGALVLAHGPEVPPDAPLLDDALALAARLGLAVQLDVKLRGIEAGVADAVRRAGLLERSFVSSYSLPILAAFADAEPALPLSLTYPEDRLGVSGSRLLRPVVRPALAVMRARLPAPPARLAARRRGARGDAELVGGHACGGRRLPRAGRRRLRLDGERPGAGRHPGRGGRRRYHHRRSSDPRPFSLSHPSAEP